MTADKSTQVVENKPKTRSDTVKVFASTWPRSNVGATEYHWGRPFSVETANVDDGKGGKIKSRILSATVSREVAKALVSCGRAKYKL